MGINLIKVLAFVAGVLLILSGMTFILWMPPSSLSIMQQTIYLAQHRMENFIYIFSVCLSSILFLPVVILLTIQYYKKNPVASIAAGSSFLLAGILQTVATLISLSRWVYILPESAKGDPNAMRLYETFQSLYLSIDLPGAILFYVAAVIYAIIFWYKSRVSALLLITSTLLLLFGGIMGSASPSISLIFSGGSIIIYGIAYITIGDLTHRFFNENV